MKISDLLGMCVRNLTRRKFRTVLTISGVVIGTCMIIVMISLSEGMKRQIDEMFNSFGDLTIIQVYSSYNSGEEVRPTDEALAEISMIPGVAAVTPFDYIEGQTQSQLFAGKNERYRIEWMDMIGVYPEALAALGYKVKDGDYIKSDSSSKKTQLLFGSSVAFNFEDTRRRRPNNIIYEGIDEFGNENVPFINPLKEDMILRIKNYDQNSKEKAVDFETSVVGIMEGGGSREYETMYSIFVDVRKMKEMQKEYNKLNNIKENKNRTVGYSNVRVKAATIRDVATVQAAIDEMGFSTYSMETTRKELESQNARTQIIYGAIGGVALLVAMISIINTMLTSVIERTREIGIMKVLGCEVGGIRTIFLIEAGLIGFFGGVLGVGLSFVLSFVINNIEMIMAWFAGLFSGGAQAGGDGYGGMMMGFGGMGMRMGGDMKSSMITPAMVVFGLVFSTVISLVAGVYPAIRATKISALEAIKQEG